jgi:hypothetical protein
MEQEDVEKTAFICHKGLFQFKRIPFGLINAGATFQRLMDTEFGNFSAFIKVYMDDIIIFSKKEEEHEKHLRLLFEKLRTFGLKLKREKCNFMVKEIKFLSHIVSDKGIKPTEEKIEAIKNLIPPKNVKR